MIAKTRLSKSDTFFDIVNHFALLAVIIIILYPLIVVISSSLSNPVYVLQGKVWFLPVDFNLDSYRRVFQNRNIMTGYRNTVLYTVAGTAFNVLMTILGAYPLSRKDLYGRNKIMIFITFTMFFYGGLIPTYLVVRSLGLYNNFWVMIIPTAVTVWNLIIMRTFFQNSIPFELVESAFIDGCSNTRILINIILPLSGPIIAVTVLFYAVGHWNAFFNALIFLSDKDKYPLQLVLREILILSKMDDMMAIGTETTTEQLMISEGLKYSVIIVSSVPVLLLYPFIQKYFVKGVMVGAIKG